MIKRVAALILVSGFLFSLTAGTRTDEMKRKLKIIIPKVRLQNVTAEQAFEFLRRESRRQDPEGKGINIIFVKKEKEERPVEKK